MSSEQPANGAPVGATPAAKQEAASAVEYDDFGLPIRKLRPRPLPENSEESSGDEKFQSAVGTRRASREDVTGESGGDVGRVVVNGEGVGKAEVEKEVPKAMDVEKNSAESKDAAPIPTDSKADNDAARPKETTADTKTSEEHAPDAKSPTDVTEKHKSAAMAHVSEYSHQALLNQPGKEEKKEEDLEWQTMPAYARWDMYDDDNKLIAKENEEELEDIHGYANVGGAAKGYTRVIMDDDADSVTSMDENTAYLFKEQSTALAEEDDEAARDPLNQMQTTKSLLTEGQRIAYVGLVRLAMVEMENKPSKLERNKGTKKVLELTQETMKMWSQKIMVRLYTHMDIDASEQVMIEQLTQHGVVPADLTPALMQNARVKNPNAEDETTSSRASVASPRPDSKSEKHQSPFSLDPYSPSGSPPPPPYQEHEGVDLPEVRTPSQLGQTKSIDIDLRWTILCDLFLVLVADSVYDARSRQLLENVGKYLAVDWLEICRFEKRVTDALEMQQEADKENWNEDDHMQDRAKRARNKRIALMGLATVGGSLVIGLSAGLLAPVIGAGLAMGFTTIGVAGTSGFLAGAGGAAIITTTGVLSGGTIAVRAANRRTGAVRTFEYRPLHNNKRVNLIVTVSGWMSGKVDDVRLPFSTVDPLMGDIYSVLWEPDMLRSMGDTINILATEALTQGLQQVLGSTLLIALMSAIQLPVALTKLSYLIDNPWSVSQARADMAGLILADSLISRNLGTRPITLVGFSLGARVIHSCLKELVKRGAYGLVQNVYLFGTPVVAKKDEYTKIRAFVPGRVVNGYAANDWILGYLFRATSGGIMGVAGLAPIDVPGIENINCTELVPGHMAYRAAMPKLLREVGWMVESEEFTEIEDPDPENHEQRQRELINEIEEARKELEQKPEKKGGFSFWRKKKAAKKDWEVYDENSVKERGVDGKEMKEKDVAALAENPVMFDLDAIRKEVAALSAEGIEVKEIPSTLPPMKIDMSVVKDKENDQSLNPYGSLRETKSYNDSIGYAPAPAGTNGTRKKSFDEYDEHADGGITMTFDDSFGNSSAARAPPQPYIARADTNPSSTWDTPVERPPLKPAATEPSFAAPPSYNAWADDFDDFGNPKDIKMTFE